MDSKNSGRTFHSLAHSTEHVNGFEIKAKIKNVKKGTQITEPRILKNIQISMYLILYMNDSISFLVQKQSVFVDRINF